MTNLVLLTAPECHLCAHGADVLTELADEGRLAWRTVDENSDEGQRLAVTAPPLRPVLFGPDGNVVAYGRLSAKRLRKQFPAAPATAGSR